MMTKNSSNYPKFVKLKHPDLDLEVLFPPGFEQRHLDSALKYQAQPGDIFVCTYPKCGTTWTQNIVWLITHYGDPIPPNKKLRDFSSMLEFDGYEFTLSTDNKQFPRIVKTHLPYGFVSQNPNAKYITVTRNPKDALVSYYYHIKGFCKAYNCPGVTLDGVFDGYLKGNAECEEYFDYVEKWYKKRIEPNVLFLLYEDLKKDPRTNILKVARFLGKDYEKSLKENNEELLQRIVALSSLKNMKDNMSIWHKTERLEDCPFIRKGEIGDWKNHFTPEQSAIADRWMKERGTACGIDKLWENHPEVYGNPVFQTKGRE